MITKIYSIFDDKAKIYNKPFHQLNAAVMHRTCMDLLQDEQTEIFKHPEDFIVYELGDYDDVKGEYELIKGKRIMFRFSELEVEERATPDIPILGKKA